MLDPAKLTYHEFHAVWDALQQYLDNRDEDEQKPAELEKIRAAERLVAQLDAAQAALAEA